MLSMVTVRCGHCTNLLSVNLRALMHSVPEQDQLQQENIRVHGTLREHHQCGGGHHLELGSSSSSRFRLPMMMSYAPQNEHLLQEQTLNNARPAPEKRQRVPSAYQQLTFGSFYQIIKRCVRVCREEIRRIKANNPDISHREAFSTAAKNWAHYPNIHFGLNSGREGGKNKLVDEAVAAVAVAPKKIQGFY
ncbi:Putative axial regulator YABBY 2 [Zea mays]|uniref:Putative axial regulator YABBY 2 n=1 Tax=Zea mays TaxID=4577 RepID=A0A1D6KGI1_MAIZE|nr:Putative axial regulator YABBY 2 [Zea mays]